MLRKVLRGLAIAVAVVGLAFVVLIAGFWYPGVTPSQTAGILVGDWKFGSRALAVAPLWGDRILEPMRAKSNDFTRLRGRNAIWVAEVLAQRPSPAGHAMSRSLFAHDSALQSMVGAVGLAGQGLLPASEFRAGGRVNRVLQDARLFADSAASQQQQEGVVQLAIIATKYARATDSVGDLAGLLSTPQDYWTHAGACEALAVIGGPAAREALRTALRDSTFHALPHAFRGLVTLQDSLAIPLAIERVSPELVGNNSADLVQELEDVTDQKFGFDREAWRHWWQGRQAPAPAKGAKTGD